MVAVQNFNLYEMMKSNETYFKMNVKKQKIVQNLVLYKYLTDNDKDFEMLKKIKTDLKNYEKAENYEMCQIYTDILTKINK